MTKTCEHCCRVYNALRRRQKWCSPECSEKAREVPTERRFWSKVNKAGPVPAHRPELGPCWEWTAGRARRANGQEAYAMFWLKSENQNVLAHRLAWTLEHGDPGELQVLHACDNQGCVRVAHLFLGTQQDNMTDKVNKSRQARGERAGRVKVTEEDVRQIRELRRSGLSQREIGERFGLSQCHVSSIVRRTVWKEVA